MKESLHNIGKAIQRHIEKEKASYTRIPAIGRAYCSLDSTLRGKEGAQQFWIVIGDTTKVLRTDGTVVHRDSKMGEVLSKYYSGKRKYIQITKNPKRKNEVEVTIHNRAIYKTDFSTAQEIVINIEDDATYYRFQRLYDLLGQQREQEKRLKALQEEEERLRKQKEEAQREAEKVAKEKARREEEERLREEARKREEEEKENRAKIAQLEKDIEESKSKVKQTQSFIRKDLSLRSQHILDETQEDAKRSHLFDGTPIVIEGGPGTGKTTTMIQRLKFLISQQALDEYNAPLTSEQIVSLTNPNTRDTNWLFFSPTDKLLSFLQDNMRGEYLNANENNTTTLESYRNKILMEYKLRKPESDGPFKLYKIKDKTETTLFLNAEGAISAFEKFCIGNISNILLNAYSLKTSDYSWHSLAQSIKAYCKRAESIKDIDALMRLFNSLYDNERKSVSQIEAQLNDLLSKKALLIKNKVDEDEQLKSAVIDLFEKWRQETIIVQEDDIEENAMDEAEDDEEELASIDYDAKLYQQLKPVLRKLSLRKYDSNQKLSKRQRDLYAIVEPLFEIGELSQIGELSWFTKNYAFLCRGVESNLLNQIPRLYKLFRKKQIEIGSNLFNKKLLEKIQKKDGGKRIHPEELELIVGFINNMLLGMYKKSHVRFNGMKNKYVEAYKENVKPVIGIDEATDYSLIDYYFMTSFCHYEYSTLTLCGDIMQGLNDNGIKSWSQLKKNILPKLEVYELKTSYRQLPSLLDMSKQMYFDDLKVEAPYTTTKVRSDNEPAPLCFISDDEEEKAEWIAKRIIEVYKTYDESMPSVAIFVGDDINIKELVDLINDQDYLNGIQIYDCSENRTAPNTKAVRVFRISEVKGMEFEVVFFYDIDTALEDCSLDIMRRYLYVGVSRATTHLAATFTQEDGNEDIIKYFDRTVDNWKI